MQFIKPHIQCLNCTRAHRFQIRCFFIFSKHFNNNRRTCRKLMNAVPQSRSSAVCCILLVDNKQIEKKSCCVNFSENYPL